MTTKVGVLLDVIQEIVVLIVSGTNRINQSKNMTQEEIQQKAYEVYPLDLDRHMIIEGEPYDNNKEKREAYIRGLTDSKPSLPSDLDEAAEEAMRRAYPGDAYYYVGRPARRLFKEGFKAGAEWMAGQGRAEKDLALTWEKKNLRSWADGFAAGKQMQKELMMKRAVEYTISSNMYLCVPRSHQKKLGLCPGDKVKILILKEDEKAD